jgi:hypothetical protein
LRGTSTQQTLEMLALGSLFSSFNDLLRAVKPGNAEMRW